MTPVSPRSAVRHPTLLAAIAGLLVGAAVGVALGLLVRSAPVGVAAGVVFALLVWLSLRRWWRTGGSARGDAAQPPGRTERPATSLGGGLPGSVGPSIEMPVRRRDHTPRDRGD